MTSDAVAFRLRARRRRSLALLLIAIVLIACSFLVVYIPIGTYRSILQEYVVPKHQGPAPASLLRQNENRLCLLRIFCRTGITLGRPRVHGDVKFESAPESALDWILSDEGPLLHQSRDGDNAPTRTAPISPEDLMVSAGYRGDDVQLKRMVQDFEHILHLIREAGPYSQTYTFELDDVAQETGLNEFVPLNPQPRFALRSNGLAEWISPPLALGAMGCLCASLWCYLQGRGKSTAKPELHSGP